MPLCPSTGSGQALVCVGFGTAAKMIKQRRGFRAVLLFLLVVLAILHNVIVVFF
jgi:hypothetical protein